MQDIDLGTSDVLGGDQEWLPQTWKNLQNFPNSPPQWRRSSVLEVAPAKNFQKLVRFSLYFLSTNRNVYARTLNGTFLYVLLCYTHVMFETENSKKLQFFVKNIIFVKIDIFGQFWLN